MQHWHPGPRWHRKEDRAPPGWWMVPAVFIGAFMWAGLYLIADSLISG